MSNWHPMDWQTLTCQQLPQYEDTSTLQQVLASLRTLKAIVKPDACIQLQVLLAKAGEGQAFVLQGGDCAEMFSDCQSRIIDRKLTMLRALSLILAERLQKPVIPIGRIAGQYAKPRSVLQETRGDLCLPTYRGDLINHPSFEMQARKPSPERLLQGYQMAAKTMNYIETYLATEPKQIRSESFWQRTAEALKQLEQAPAFDLSMLKNTDITSLLPIFTSHEALLLPYEAALTRAEASGWYNAGTHFPWIGMRTADPDAGHVAYAKGIMNPIAVKISTQMNAESLTKLIYQLNPDKIPGHLTFIHRLGFEAIKTHLPALIKAAKKTNVPIVWLCDPMHGNTHFLEKGRKTRFFTEIASELSQAVSIHKQQDSVLAGMHLEMTDEAVIECLDSTQAVSDLHSQDTYKSLVDPRLNYPQTLALLMGMSV